MSAEVTRILSAIEQGDPHAADQLLPLVYAELRKLAAQRIAQEKPGQTLEPSALVHEAYLRLVDPEKVQTWNGRGHFFAAAAEAMRRILVDCARRKQSEKHGGSRVRVELDRVETAAKARPEELLAIDDLIERLTRLDPSAGKLLKLRYFAEMSVEEAAATTGQSRTNTYRLWHFVRAWLRCELGKNNDAPA